MKIKTRNNLYYVKTELLVEYRIIADCIEQAIEQVKKMEKDRKIIEAKLLEENIYVGV